MILVLGAFLLFAAIGGPARERSGALERVSVGDTASSVDEILQAEPVRCPADSLDHLRSSFPDGWSEASIDVALETLVEMTAERWVYPLEAGRETLCSATEQRTEIGVGGNGQVVWMVGVLGRTPVELPPSLTPAGVQETVADST